MSKTIRFKSKPDYWYKEYFGLKRNTIRTFSNVSDIRLEVLKDFLKGNVNMINIEITNTETLEVFIRKVTDVSWFEPYYIISW